MLTKNLKKLTYRLHYRGTKELDVFFSSASKKLAFLKEEEIKDLDLLVQEEEAVLQNWVAGVEPIPEKYKSIFAKLLT